MATSDSDLAPVLVGVAQKTWRDAVDPERAPGPVERLAGVVRAAADDAGVRPQDLAECDPVGVVDVLAWRPKNAPRLLADALGAKPTCEIATAVGGESPLPLVNLVAGRIAAGETEMAVVAGTNFIKMLRRARAAGLTLALPMGGGGEPERLGKDLPGSSPTEVAHGLAVPTIVYPLLENALRARRGLDLDAHRRQLGALFAPFTEEAARNPHAWFPVARTAEEIATPSAANRMVAFPYPKYLNAVIDTDQDAAVIMMSARAARARGIPEDRWVHWWGGAHASEEAWFPSERPDLARSPALAAAALTCLARAGIELRDVDAFDFYSCFPVAVSMACEMLGLAESDRRGLTVTGGLPYAGGPGNNYSLHSLAAMVERVRGRVGSIGMVTGNGWYLTKHSACVVASAPRRERMEDFPEVGPAAPLGDGAKALSVVEQATGSATVDGYTVVYDREGAPVKGIVIGRLSSGERFVANTPEDRDLLEEMVRVEIVGREGHVRVEGERNRFDLR